MSLGATYYRDRLAEVNAAIARVESGAQSYAIEGRSLARGRLEELYAERRRLEPLALRETREAAAATASVIRISTSKGL